VPRPIIILLRLTDDIPGLVHCTLQIPEKSPVYVLFLLLFDSVGLAAAARRVLRHLDACRPRLRVQGSGLKV
jgi:hypothetical protein